jgi:hypothetical protein
VLALLVAVACGAVLSRVSHLVRARCRGCHAGRLHGPEAARTAQPARRDGGRHARLLPAADPLLLLAEHPDRPLAAGGDDAAHGDADPPAWRPAEHHGRHTALRRSAHAAGDPLHARPLPALSAGRRAALGPAAGCPQRPQRLVRADDPGQHRQPRPERRDRLPRPFRRPAAGARKALLARPGARILRRPHLEAARRPQPPAAGRGAGAAHRLRDHPRAAPAALAAGARRAPPRWRPNLSFPAR